MGEAIEYLYYIQIIIKNQNIEKNYNYTLRGSSDKIDPATEIRRRVFRTII